MGKQLIKFYNRFSLDILKKKEAELKERLNEAGNSEILKVLLRNELFAVKDSIKMKIKEGK